MGRVSIMMKRIMDSTRQDLRNFTLWSLAVPGILLVVLGSVAYGLGNIIPQLNFWLLFSISMVSMTLAWFLASTRIRTIFAILVSLFFAIPVVLVRAGGLEKQLMSTLYVFLDSLNITLIQTSSGVENPSSTLTLIQDPVQELFVNIGTLLGRSGDWITSVALGKPVFDPVVTVLVWGLIAWVVSFWAGWLVRRDNRPLLSILPAGSLLAIAHSYTISKTTAILAMLGVTIFFIGMVQQSYLEKHWRLHEINIQLDIRRVSLFFVAILSISIVILSALTPSISIQDIIELGQRWTSGSSEDTDGYAESLGLSSRPRRERTAIDNVRVSGLPQKHLLGSGPELSEKIVFQVHTLEGPNEGPQPTYYWRSITYDQYTGSGWLTSGTNTEPYEAGQLVTSTKRFFQQSLKQEVDLIGPVGRLLFFAGTLVSVNQDFFLSQRSNQDIFGASIETDAYLVNTLLPVFNENELRKTGTDYPDWIQKRYLSLPEDLPQRVRDLAQQLTATVQTPYDRAVVIETYLREFPYSLEVPATSRYRDIADHFLFDLKRGYCGYYATTMAVLARAAGLPARLVIGYASNNYENTTKSFNVTQADAHAWVEIFFQEFGWVEFEPTPNRPPIPRLQEPFAADSSLHEETIQSPGILNLKSLPINLSLQSLWSGLVKFLGVILLFGMVGIFSWIRIDAWRMRLMAPVFALELLYQRLRSFARHLEIPYRPGDTPYEFIATFTQYVDQEFRQGPPLTDFFQSVRNLVNFYVQANYTPQPPTAEESKMIVASWARIQYQLTRFWINKRLERVLQRRRKRAE